MQRAFTLLFCLCSLLTVMSAQNLPAPQGCGYDHYVHALEQAYPGFRAAAQPAIERAKTNPIDQNKTLTTYTIPVVVHIVYQNEDQNLADSLIDQVLAVLNEDYRRLNLDAVNVRENFMNVVGDAGIEFELAGVERVATEATFSLDLLSGTLPDNVKATAEGGSDAWDTEHYLNIWVCSIEGGSLLGYAYPPADLAHWPEGANAPTPEVDGVVIHNEVFRRTGTYTSSGLLGLGEMTVPVRGRTITHEVAHYLGLRHIWGDGLLSILGFPDCSVDDGVADTPNQGMSSQFSCDPEQNSCADEVDDQPDMYENFMDYASDDCMNSFTLGQIAIMRGVLENERSGLLNSPTGTVVQNAMAQQFAVFPNPAQAELSIAPLSSTATTYGAKIFNVQGQLVWQAGELQQTTRVAVQRWPAGLYTLLLQQDGQQYAQRVLIQE